MTSPEHVAGALSAAWNASDGAAFARCFTSEADFVNILGEYYAGHDAIAKQHQAIFDSIYRGSTIEFTVSRARPLADGLVLAQIKSELHVPAGPRAGTMRTLATAVLVKSAAKWHIGSFHNTEVRALAFGSKPQGT